MTAPTRLCRCGHPEHDGPCHGISRPVGSTPPGFQPRTERCRCLAFELWEQAS